MKAVFLAVAILVSLNVLGQFTAQEWKAIPRGAKQIEVETGLSDSVNYTNVLNRLVRGGFEIEKSDAAMGTITTRFRPLHPAGAFYIYARCFDCKIIFSGVYDFNPTEAESIYYNPAPRNLSDIEKRGQRGSIGEKAFYQLWLAAVGFGTVKYTFK